MRCDRAPTAALSCSRPRMNAIAISSDDIVRLHWPSAERIMDWQGFTVVPT
jgi:hypothetical protein